MKFNCENLEVYKLSRELVVLIYKITDRFSVLEKLTFKY